MTEEEQYFRKQISDLKPEDEAIVASGYFRSYLGERASFVAAAQAFGCYIALTDENLFFVKTRAPASRKPLLENTDSFCIPLEQINELVLLPEVLGISHQNGDLALEMWVTNKYFDTQQRLLDYLAEHLNLETRTSGIISGKKKNKLKKALFIVAGITVGIIWALMK